MPNTIVPRFPWVLGKIEIKTYFCRSGPGRGEGISIWVPIPGQIPAPQCAFTMGWAHSAADARNPIWDGPLFLGGLDVLWGIILPHELGRRERRRFHGILRISTKYYEYPAKNTNLKSNNGESLYFCYLPVKLFKGFF